MQTHLFYQFTLFPKISYQSLAFISLSSTNNLPFRWTTLNPRPFSLALVVCEL
ncbi:hypothetical protein [Campylobacter phage CJLB-10]|nr:hypothetical protein [Campylobacter phage CJLB-10]